MSKKPYVLTGNSHMDIVDGERVEKKRGETVFLTDEQYRAMRGKFRPAPNAELVTNPKPKKPALDFTDKFLGLSEKEFKELEARFKGDRDGAELVTNPKKDEIGEGEPDKKDAVLDLNDEFLGLGEELYNELGEQLEHVGGAYFKTTAGEQVQGRNKAIEKQYNLNNQ